ncbi:hypothetical protein F383_16277 [Gossypium arboreum]|uniref:Uncharacterized protein n=1 Tax=Gossypium arboreum TaxID=29729 RepID=A0A0B0NFM9_GOSAR|nr:hypothetical protein F383_16277 [Gossypium arboreum]
MVYKDDIVNEFNEYVTSRKSHLNLRNNLGYNYRQASSVTEGRDKIWCLQSASIFILYSACDLELTLAI